MKDLEKIEETKKVIKGDDAYEKQIIKLFLIVGIVDLFTASMTILLEVKISTVQVDDFGFVYFSFIMPIFFWLILLGIVMVLHIVLLISYLENKQMHSMNIYFYICFLVALPISVLLSLYGGMWLVAACLVIMSIYLIILFSTEVKKIKDLKK